MIGFLRGKLVSISDIDIVLDVGGVGYEIETGAGYNRGLSPGAEISLFIETVVREDSIRLFGFPDEASKKLFVMLHSISGIGPKSASAILDTLGARGLVSALRTGNWSAFRQVPGVGEKTARKILLEGESKVLKMRLDFPESTDAPVENRSLFDDLASAMVNLGYNRAQVEKVIHSSWTENADFESMFRLITSKLSALKDGKSQ